MTIGNTEIPMMPSTTNGFKLEKKIEEVVDGISCFRDEGRG